MGAIPDFDSHGNIPVGDLFAGSGHNSLYHTTLQEVRQRFVNDVPGSGSRQGIWDGWMRHRDAVESLGIAYCTLVDGSFCTAALTPGDVDLLYVFDSAGLNALASADQLKLLALLGGPAMKSHFSCDVYAVPAYPVTSPAFPQMITAFTYWTRVFGLDRVGRQKSILLITERGTI